MNRVTIIGAGFGGLSVGAALSRAGLDITVLEAHVYPGGCAGTFYHKGYRFDAGATLAGGFAPGAPMDRFGKLFDIDWEARLASRAMVVHMPNQTTITRWTAQDLWEQERQNQFGKQAESFWRWQETTADALWKFTQHMPPWPPQTLPDWLNLGQIVLASPAEILKAAPGAFRPISTHLRNKHEQLRIFLDGQLLISSQTTTAFANALYSAAALDLPRLGVAHVPKGIGGMAEKLVAAIRREGGQVHFRQKVTKVSKQPDGTFRIATEHGNTFTADKVVFNLPPWNIAPLLANRVPDRLLHLPEKPPYGWGAFMVYIGLDKKHISANLALHHQILQQEPFGEGNSIFISISPAWDKSRAPVGKRALTISTHTRYESWWDLYRNHPDEYNDRKNAYLDRILSLAERAVPGIAQHTDLIMPGTPVTFQRYTHRSWGWVGGFPQTNLFQTWGPRLAPGLWMVGDTIFPGQSIPAVMMGGHRVANQIKSETDRSRRFFIRQASYPARMARD